MNKPLTIYDVDIDALRPATQEDIDRLCSAVSIMSIARQNQHVPDIEAMTHLALVGKLSPQQFTDQIMVHPRPVARPN
jgi:ADP-dependent phosphofructokinase/glucokinase